TATWRRFRCSSPRLPRAVTRRGSRKRPGGLSFWAEDSAALQGTRCARGRNGGIRKELGAYLNSRFVSLQVSDFSFHLENSYARGTHRASFRPIYRPERRYCLRCQGWRSKLGWSHRPTAGTAPPVCYHHSRL